MKHEFLVEGTENTKIYFIASNYVANNGIYLGAIVSEDDGECPGEPWSDVTVCLPQFNLNEDEVIVPIYNMGNDTFETIKKALVEEVIRDVRHGYATSKLVRLKPNWRDLVVQMPETED